MKTLGPLSITSFSVARSVGWVSGLGVSGVGEGGVEGGVGRCLVKLCVVGNARSLALALFLTHTTHAQMFFFAVGHMCAFPAEEFERTAIPRHRTGRLDKTSATSHLSVRTVWGRGWE